MSIVFRRIRGRIVPIRTDGAKQKKTTVGETIAKTTAIGGAAGGAGYFGFRRAHEFFTSAADRADKWLGRTRSLAQHIAGPKGVPGMGHAGGRGVIKITKTPRLKKDGTPYKVRAGKTRLPVEPLPGQGDLFGNKFKPVNKSPSMAADDVLKFAVKTKRSEFVGRVASFIGRAARSGASKTVAFRRYSPVAATVIGVAVGAKVFYDDTRGRKK